MVVKSQVGHADRVAFWLLAATVLAAFARQVWVLQPGVRFQPDQLLGNAIAALPALFAALTCWHVARASKQTQRGWFIVGAAAFCTFAGDATWLILQNVLRLDPFPSLADLFYLLVAPLLAWGVLSFPRDAFRPTEIARVSLNVAIVVAGIGTFAWRFVLAPLIERNLGEGWLEFGIALAYPLYDLALLSLTLFLLLRPSSARLRAQITWIFVAITCLAVGDLAFAVSSAQGSEELTQPMNAFFAWFSACLAAGAAFSLGAQRRAATAPRTLAASSLAMSSVPGMLAPFVAIIGTFVLYVSETPTSPLAHVGTYVGTITVTVLVMLRQGFAFADNLALNNALRQLSTELEARVADRTRQMEWNATHDPLTALPNRTLLQTFLDSALEHDRVAVMFVDLDGFKRINDTLGHAVGDDLLRAVAARLKRCFSVSALIARTGGDEFVIVLPSVSQGDVERAGRGVIAALEEPFLLSGAAFSISASIGYALAPRDGRDAETLQRHADAAMYSAKSLGHGKVQGFSAEIKANLDERLEIELQLRHAISRNELELHYQPIVDAQTGRIHTLEALLRWRNAKLGRVSPDRFIPVAEESGLIVPLTEWVLHCACAQNAAWQLAGLPKVCVAVNISMLQIGQDELLRTVTHALEVSGLDARYLQLELVETVLAQPQASSAVAELRALGITVAMDDFGTGYSSLSYLGQLPVDTLKIAQAFTANLYREGSQDSALALLEAITGVAKSLKLRVTAEGVETEQQLQRLRALGCDSIQGYLYAAPANAETAARWLETGSLRAATPTPVVQPVTA
jgi:diguanylate cyclase (GGDEF)-like protein